MLWVSSGGEDANAAGEAEKPDLMSAEPGHPAVAAASHSLRLSRTLPCLCGWQQQGGRAAEFLDPDAGRWQGKGGAIPAISHCAGGQGGGEGPLQLAEPPAVAIRPPPEPASRSARESEEFGAGLFYLFLAFFPSEPPLPLQPSPLSPDLMMSCWE